MRLVNDKLFRERPDGAVRLIGGYCAGCERVHFPQGDTCPYCSLSECTESELGPRATLWLFTSVLRPPPGYRGQVPFGFGIVELEQGLRVVTRLTEPDLAKLHRGMTMKLVISPLHTAEDGERVTTYAFAPEPTV